MNDLTLSISKEARQRHPYRSLYAAMLFQSFEDALAEALSTDTPADRDEAAPRKRQSVLGGQSPLAQQA